MFLPVSPTYLATLAKRHKDVNGIGVPIHSDHRLAHILDMSGLLVYVGMFTLFRILSGNLIIILKNAISSFLIGNSSINGPVFRGDAK